MNCQSNPLTKVLFLVPTLIVAVVIAATPASAQLFTLGRTFDDPTVTTRDNFGFSVALDGNQLLVGDPFDDTNGLDVGRAHLFDTDGNLLQTFDDPNVSANRRDWFGISVSLDGNRVLIGASGGGVSDGQAHLFDADGNLLQTFDDPTNTDIDRFGDSVAVDGSLVLIGAPLDDTNGWNVGQAHLFDAISGSLLHTFDDPTPTDRDNFGSLVAVDGNRVLIGANLDDTNGEIVGQAHLFDAISGNLLHTFNDPTVTDRDRFGLGVAVDGNRVLIGAFGDDTNGLNVGQAHLFDNDGNLLQTFDDPTVTDEDWFGLRVALDGNRVLIGASYDDTNGENVGQAHLFDAISGNLLQTFDDPTVTDKDGFGSRVALDRNRVLVGAPRDDTNGLNVGQVHLFTPSCDFTSDAECEIEDLNTMLAEGPIAPGVTVTPGVNDQFDLTGDGVIDLGDLDRWLADAGTIDGFASPYKRADANLDGVVDGQDFVLWNGGKFNSTLLWNVGDWNGDGVADGQDFIIWNQNKFTSSDGVSAVPEPGTSMLLLVAILLGGAARIRR